RTPRTAGSQTTPVASRVSEGGLMMPFVFYVLGLFLIGVGVYATITGWGVLAVAIDRSIDIVDDVLAGLSTGVIGVGVVLFLLGGCRGSSGVFVHRQRRLTRDIEGLRQGAGGAGRPAGDNGPR